MFDVVWTDHNRESVGARRKRKGEKESESGRRSASTNRSSTSDKVLGILPSNSRRRAATSSQLPSPTQDPSKDEDLQEGSSATYDTKAILSHEDDSEVTVKPASGAAASTYAVEPADESSIVSSRESVLSKEDPPSLAASSTLTGISPRTSVTTRSEHLIQTLGSSSFVTKSTEVIVSSRDSDFDADLAISEIHISSDRAKQETPPLPELPEDGTPVPFDSSDPLRLSPRLPQTPPPTDYPNSTALVDSNWADSDHLANPDAWKPPHEWDCSPARDIPSPTLDERVQAPAPERDANHYMSPDLVTLQREIRMMLASSPELTLANLKSEMGEASDAMVYKELEMTKKRWMFSALHNAEGYADFDRPNTHTTIPNPSRPPRTLAVYETQASASFLAALYPHTAMSHLSPNPVSPNLFPNVQPILVPSISTSTASRLLPPQLYTTVTCLSMPALFPSTEIPPFLRHINRCLAPSGALHLTLIDPQPVSASMGPKLRNWLLEKLLINLEQTFRTTYPSGTFPAWLAVGRLRGKGSTIATVSVAAVPEGIGKIKGVKGLSSTEAELKCLIMRMLWQEVWGTFVGAERWWWEEPEILEECANLGTYWQYSHIIAVKEDR